MDAHFDQVMRAREQAKDGPACLYFAYSTILDREAFNEWKAQHGYETFALPEGELAQASDVELVFDFPSRWWGGRVAGLADAKGQSVWGRVFRISPRDWPIIQHKEGFITHMCVEREVSVMVKGERQTATAFTTRPERQSQDGAISARFVEALVRGAKGAGLPADYVTRLGTYAG
ncbi:MAG: gamma-glutamylcyclotransferase family protein [Myxococcaceae bacterium]